jgi:hypothetical protein
MAKTPTTKAPAKKAPPKPAAPKAAPIDVNGDGHLFTAALIALGTARHSIDAAVAANDAAAAEAAFSELAVAAGNVLASAGIIEQRAQTYVAEKLKAADEEAARQLADKRKALDEALAALETGTAIANATGTLQQQSVGDDDAFAPAAGRTRIRVTGPARGRRRAGFDFGAEARDVDVDALQLEQIKGDPSLRVELID